MALFIKAGEKHTIRSIGQQEMEILCFIPNIGDKRR